MQVPLTPEIIVDSSDSGLGQYKTISEAIDNAQPNTRIRVRPGVYKESIVIDKPVEIIGKGSVKDIVIESIESSCILMQTDQATVRGLTLRCQVESEESKYSAVDIPQGQLILENCDITSSSFACINIYGSQSNPIIRNCRIHDGHLGISISEKAQGIVEDCDIFANTSAGIAILEDSNPIVWRCRIYDEKFMGIIIYDKGRGVIENCYIFSNKIAGIKITNGGNDILINHCQIYDHEVFSIVVEENSQATIENCHIFFNDLGIATGTGSNIFIRHCQIHENQIGIGVEEVNQIIVEDCDIFSNDGGILTTGNNLNILIRNCQINHHFFKKDEKGNISSPGLGIGIMGIDENREGMVTVGDCDIFSNSFGIGALQSSILMRRCQIYDHSSEIDLSENDVKEWKESLEVDEEMVILAAKGLGIVGLKNSQITLEDCELFANGKGLKVSEDSNAITSNCRIDDLET